MAHDSGRVHDVARDGFGTGTNELYDRARPSYQREAILRVFEALGSKHDVNVVEIGAGTGIFTRALLATPEWSTALAELRAVEPSEGMRTVFSQTVRDPQARVSVREGTFDNTGIPDGWADIVIVAQAFHWCPNFEGALKEFARVLQPNGVVALVWNLEDREKAGWVANLRDSYEVFEKGTPQFRLGLWRGVFSSPSYATFFREPSIAEREILYNLPATLASVEDRVRSKSYIAMLSDEEKEQVSERVRDIVAKGEDMVWIDKEKGVFEYPYYTTVVLMHRK